MRELHGIVFKGCTEVRKKKRRKGKRGGLLENEPIYKNFEGLIFFLSFLYVKKKMLLGLQPKLTK